MTADSLFSYSVEALSFDFAGKVASALPPPPGGLALARMVSRAVVAWERASLSLQGQPALTLLGLGSGALAAELARELPPGTLCVCEPDLALARSLREAGLLPWWMPGGPAALVADSSPWAALLLLDRAGRGPGRALVLANPELGPEEKRALRPLELLLTRSRPLAAPGAAPVPRLFVAAILAPSEPDLAEFFAQMPDWIAGLALVWDADQLPDVPVPDRFPVWQLARPLRGDFSAQRNAMLGLCAGDWVLYLDADERLSPAGWAALPALCAAPGVSGWRLPRVSPYPTPERALIGFGLWPDVQLRLFRNLPGLRFENPVHERLVGLPSGQGGGQGLAPGVEIEHLSRLRKGREEQARKLRGFDEAGAGAVRHALSAEYPSAPRGVVSGAEGLDAGLLLLPPELA